MLQTCLIKKVTELYYSWYTSNTVNYNFFTKKLWKITPPFKQCIITSAYFSLRRWGCVYQNHWWVAHWVMCNILFCNQWERGESPVQRIYASRYEILVLKHPVFSYVLWCIFVEWPDKQIIQVDSWSVRSNSSNETKFSEFV